MEHQSWPLPFVFYGFNNQPYAMINKNIEDSRKQSTITLINTNLQSNSASNTTVTTKSGMLFLLG